MEIQVKNATGNGDREIGLRLSRVVALSCNYDVIHRWVAIKRAPMLCFMDYIVEDRIQSLAIYEIKKK